MIKVSNKNRHIILESILMWAQESGREIQRPFSDRVDHYGCVIEGRSHRPTFRGSVTQGPPQSPTITNA